MASLLLFEGHHHRNVLFEESAPNDTGVQTNQHLIVHEGGGLVLDPGGHKVYSRVLADTMKELGGGKLDSILLSHQDPDVTASVNGWLMSTDATAFVSDVWLRFVPHLGLDRLVINRLRGLPDEGALLDLRGLALQIIPAHFLHSPGNFHVYDPVSKILYSGDLGMSATNGLSEVTDFDAQVPHLLPSHQRLMASGRTLKKWVAMIRGLDIERIAPQHGASFVGRPMVERFLSWLETIEVGVDLFDQAYRLPTKFIK